MKPLFAADAISDRTDDQAFVFEGFISANLRKPTGGAWDTFTDEVRAAFSDSRFDDFTRLTADDEVQGFPVTHFLLHPNCSDVA